ncbi:unnamed protein product [Lota lota]
MGTVSVARVIPLERRVLTILRWLSLPDDERPYVYAVHSEQPDTFGHRLGPLSSELDNPLKEIDNIIGQLMTGLKQMNLHRCVNVIVVGDHGMEEAHCDKMEFLSSYPLNIDEISLIPGSLGRIRPRDPKSTTSSLKLAPPPNNPGHLFGSTPLSSTQHPQKQLAGAPPALSCPTHCPQEDLAITNLPSRDPVTMPWAVEVVCESVRILPSHRGHFVSETHSIEGDVNGENTPIPTPTPGQTLYTPTMKARRVHPSSPSSIHIPSITHTLAPVPRQPAHKSKDQRHRKQPATASSRTSIQHAEHTATSQHHSSNHPISHSQHQQQQAAAAASTHTPAPRGFWCSLWPHKDFIGLSSGYSSYPPSCQST